MDIKKALAVGICATVPFAANARDNTAADFPYQVNVDSKAAGCCDDTTSNNDKKAAKNVLTCRDMFKDNAVISNSTCSQKLGNDEISISCEPTDGKVVCTLTIP